MNENLLKIFKWGKSVVSDDKGIGSSKRTSMLLLIFLVIFIIVYTLLVTPNGQVANINWTSIGILIGIIFAHNTTLAAGNVIEKRNILKENKKTDKETDTNS